MDRFLEIFDGDLVGVSIGEFGDGGEDLLLLLHHGLERSEGTGIGIGG